MIIMEKDKFYDLVQEVVSGLPVSELVYPCGDWNGHIGISADGFEGVHGGFSFGDRNSDGERILEFAVANNLVIGNSFFHKRVSHLITYESGLNKSTIDFILTRKRDMKLIRDVKVIPSEEIVPQHKLLVCDLKLTKPITVPKVFTPKLKSWKLREPDTIEAFHKSFVDKLNTNLVCLVNHVSLSIFSKSILKCFNDYVNALLITTAFN